jgi:hypothetical protein
MFRDRRDHHATELIVIVLYTSFICIDQTKWDGYLALHFIFLFASEKISVPSDFHRPFKKLAKVSSSDYNN